MAAYSYEDFVKKAQSAGLLDSFSEYDLALAKQQPAAGISILSFKQDYREATTDEARALANAGAEQVRKTYGGYLGGAAGLEYQPVGQTGAESAASSVSSGAGSLGAYFEQAERLWNDYRRQYLREGERAYQNALGEAAANTGGVASTAAVAAAQQAQGYYASQAADAKASVYQQAFENWLAERQQRVSEAQQSAAQTEAESEAAQQSFENAMSKWKAYGYVTQDVAEILALPVGTAYSDQAYKQWQQAFEEAKSGVTTNQTMYDTVNLGERVVTETADDHETLRYGANSLEVQTLQEYLLALGYSCGSGGADGKFGTATHRALLRFQKDHGVYADGVCGPVTWTALLKALEE